MTNYQVLENISTWSCQCLTQVEQHFPAVNYSAHFVGCWKS